VGALRILALTRAAAAVAATAASPVAATAAWTAPATAMAPPALAAAAPEATSPTAPWRPHIEEASRKFGVPVSLIERVMIAESGGRTMWNGRPTVSRAGAMGLMQLMPATWNAMRRRLGLGHDPHAPRDNILAGTLYLRLMYDRFGYPGLFGAYNAGPARYAAYLEGRRALPGETRDYLRKVAGSAAPPPPRGTPALAVIAAKPKSPDPETPAVKHDLFFIRR
jgi:soluble lytic murein transglycosylase-like protein